MTTKREQLAKIRQVLGPDAVESALRFMPDRATETAIECEIRERKEAERTARVLAMRDTRDALLSGVYGAEAKRKAIAMVNDKGRNAVETLKYCSKLANQIRKSTHYRNVAIERKAVP